MKPYGYTDEQIKAALAKYKDWASRVSKENIENLVAFIEAKEQMLVAFMLIEDSVEFSDEEKSLILDGFSHIEKGILDHATRATGYQKGIGLALARKQSVDKMVEKAQTVALGDGCFATFISKN